MLQLVLELFEANPKRIRKPDERGPARPLGVLDLRKGRLGDAHTFGNDLLGQFEVFPPGACLADAVLDVSAYDFKRRSYLRQPQFLHGHHSALSTLGLFNTASTNPPAAATSRTAIRARLAGSLTANCAMRRLGMKAAKPKAIRVPR